MLMHYAIQVVKGDDKKMILIMQLNKDTQEGKIATPTSLKMD